MLQEYRSRKQTRLHRRLEEQLRRAVPPPSEGASTSDLSEVLQSFRGPAPSKGTHFSHTQKFSFTRVSPSSSLLHSSGFILHPPLCPQDQVAVATPITIAEQPEGDAQLHQQVLTSLEQQVEQLDAHLLHLSQDMKHMSVTHTQVTHTHLGDTHTRVTHTLR